MLPLEELEDLCDRVVARRLGQPVNSLSSHPPISGNRGRKQDIRRRGRITGGDSSREGEPGLWRR